MNIDKRVQTRIREKTLQNRFMALFMAFAIVVLYVVNCQLIIPGVSMSVGEFDIVEPTFVGEGSLNSNPPISNKYGADGNIVNETIYSPASLPLLTLLFGEGRGVEWLGGAETVDEALEKAQDVYFLGLASDFCVFLKENMDVKEADAEGGGV